MGVGCCRRAVQENEALVCKQIATEIEATNSKPQNPYGYTGLDNMGNTCFINACLQCLSHCDPLVQYLLRSNTTNSDHKFLKFLQDLVTIQWRKIYGSIVPRRILDIVTDQFQIGRQYDAHEFLIYLLNKLMEEDRYLDELFQGELKISVTCNQCNYTVVRAEHFYTLSLPILNFQCSLKDCVSSFLKLESIDNWQCSNCGTATSAQKATEISKLPEVLIIHLKRFEIVEGKIQKNTKKVDCDSLRLDIKLGSKQEKQFNLFAVVDHYGDLSSGHYTASVLHRLTFKWQLCNDHAIYATDFDDVISEYTYLMFYVNTSFNETKPKIWKKREDTHQLSTTMRDTDLQEIQKTSLESSFANLPHVSSLFSINLSGKFHLKS